jgi:hypothetical protein
MVGSASIIVTNYRSQIRLALRSHATPHDRVYASRRERGVLHEYRVSLLLSDRAIAPSPVI